MKRLLIVASFLAAFIPSTSAMAQDSSPYVVGHWNLADTFDSETTTEDTDFTFLNPTDLTLTLEYAFFGINPDGTVTFCGCDRDKLQPNGRTRYTMSQEVSGGQFSTTLCPTQTEGELKAIVFTRLNADNAIVVGDAVQAGVQIHILANGDESESNLQGVTINRTTTREMSEIHKHCVTFIGS